MQATLYVVAKSTKPNGAPHAEKPTLHLMKLKGRPTIEDATRLYKALTGRDPTPAELASSQALLDADAAKGAAAKSGQK
jgi:hypothetical protein